MSKPLEIKVRLDRSAAQQAAREHNADARKMADAIKESFADQRKAIADSVKASADEQKAIARDLANDERAYRKQLMADSVQRARDSAKAVADARRDAAKETTKLEQMEGQKRFSQDQVIQAARKAMIQDENSQRVDALKKVMEGAKAAAEAQKNGGSMVVSGMKAAGSAVLGLVSAYATLGTVTQVISSIAGMWQAMRQDSEAAADALTKQRQEMLAIAALKDNPGRSTQEIGDQLQFREQTLQTAREANVFQKGALNTGQASIAGGFIDKDEFKKLMVHGGSFQAANPAVEPDAFGNLMGLMPTMIGKQGQDPKDVARRTFGVMKTFEKGSSDPGPAVRQFQQNSALVQPGLYASPEEMAAVQSAFSSTSPNEAGTLTKQFLRGTVGGLTRQRGSNFEGSIPQAEYLKKLHATDQMGAVQIGDLIAADLKEQEAKAKAGGKNFNTQTYLTTQGYQDEESRMAVMGYAQRKNSGQWDRTFEPMSHPENAPTFAAGMQHVKDFQRVEPVALARKAEVAKDISTATVGIGAPEYYQNMRRVAFESLKAQGKTYGDFDETNKSDLWQGAIVDEVKRLMDIQAAKVNIKPPALDFVDNAPGLFSLGLDSKLGGAMGMGSGRGVMGGNPFSRFAYSQKERQEAFYDYGQRIKEAGGSDVSLKEVNDNLKILIGHEVRKENRAAKGPQPDPAPDPGAIGRVGTAGKPKI